jgi:hypothetical protein
LLLITININSWYKKCLEEVAVAAAKQEIPEPIFSARTMRKAWRTGCAPHATGGTDAAELRV